MTRRLASALLRVVARVVPLRDREAWLQEMTRFLYAIRPGDPLTLAVTASVLATAAALACLLPARRATRSDPLVVLRAE